MPRLRQVPRSEAEAPIVTVMYDLLFENRDPVAEPGTSDGTPGDWWTVFALVPDVLEHAVQGFGLYQSPKRLLDPVLRELAQARVGWASGSQFVYSQHCKSLRALDIPDDMIDSVPHWAAATCFDPTQRLVLAYTDCLALDHRFGPVVELGAQSTRHHGVLQDVGHQGEDRPPVARRPVGGAGLGHRVAVREQQVVHDGDDGCLRLGARHLPQSGHRRAQAVAVSTARAGSWDTSSGPRARVQQANSSRMPSGSWK